jgi:RNA polymerase-associated protein RTF1
MTAVPAHHQRQIDILKQKDEAEQKSDIDMVRDIQQQVFELDEKASDIERKSTGSFAMLAYGDFFVRFFVVIYDILCFCREINQRNRQLTSVRVVEAIKKDSEEKQKDELDPFTRRKCIPTLVSKVN